MNTAKLREALVELKRQRALLDSAISNLGSVVQTLDDAPVEVAKSGKRREKESYLDLAVRILEEAGKPMHIVQITQKVSEMRGKNVPRPSVESSLLRNIKVGGSKARVVRTRPAHFGLPIWKSFTRDQEPLLSNLASLTRAS